MASSQADCQRKKNFGTGTQLTISQKYGFYRINIHEVLQLKKQAWKVQML